jgi:hypothetical protein
MRLLRQLPEDEGQDVRQNGNYDYPRRDITDGNTPIGHFYYLCGHPQFCNRPLHSVHRCGVRSPRQLKEAKLKRILHSRLAALVFRFCEYKLRPLSVAVDRMFYEKGV